MLATAQMGLRPEALPDLAERAALLVNGRADPIVQTAQAEELAALLGDAGAGVDLRWHGGGHGVGAQEMAPTRARGRGGCGRRPGGGAALP